MIEINKSNSDISDGTIALGDAITGVSWRLHSVVTWPDVATVFTFKNGSNTIAVYGTQDGGGIDLERCKGEERLFTCTAGEAFTVDVSPTTSVFTLNLLATKV